MTSSFAGANRGKYISVAAPGVDILVPAPASSYQLTTGTSVAAAQRSARSRPGERVSGIVALLLERNPEHTPADIRRILTASAKRLGPGEGDANFGAGLRPTRSRRCSSPSRTAWPRPCGRHRRCSSSKDMHEADHAQLPASASAKHAQGIAQASH